jgi:hypothetical protein
VRYPARHQLYQIRGNFEMTNEKINFNLVAMGVGKNIEKTIF